MIGNECSHRIALTMSLSYREAANGEAVKGEFTQTGSTLLSQLRMTGALHDTKQRLR